MGRPGRAPTQPAYGGKCVPAGGLGCAYGRVHTGRNKPGDVKGCAKVSLTDQLDFDRESCDPLSANTAAATVLRQLAAQLEHAGLQARLIRSCEVEPAERARRLDFALMHLASVMSEMEMIGLINALRHAATAAEDVHECQFCGAPIQPWSMLTTTSRGGWRLHAVDRALLGSVRSVALQELPHGGAPGPMAGQYADVKGPTLRSGQTVTVERRP